MRYDIDIDGRQAALLELIRIYVASLFSMSVYNM